MSTESRILLSNIISPESTDSATNYGEKKPGAGFNRYNNGLHTVIYETSAFSGTIRIQGTLEMYPAESDWIDINDSIVEAWNDSTIFQTGAVSRNFTGNFLWIRAAYNLQNGTIVSVRYNT